ATVPMMDVERNFGLASYPRFSAMGVIRGRLRRTEAGRAVEELAVKPRSIGAAIRSLSGGNQQKVIIARWLASGARIFLFDEPTRGIDVGAKSEIHALIRRLAAQGASVLVVSSELPELLMLSDRIAVMHEGRMTGILDNGPGLTEERLLHYASGEMTP
ncbi:ATP-binding cassette domain-containing protein, partial [Nostoc sp. NIES-2111]